ncbi:MAG: phosphoribosylglycinamide formyltransferase [Thermoplasmata archaeon]|nr:phosphoribosylglycinamide formyltransferase [Thermoplasmata archaeon]
MWRRERVNIGVLASGRGTDFQSIVDAVESGELDANIAVLIYNNKDAYVGERAEKAGIPAIFVDHRKKKREVFEREMVEVLRDHDVELVVLAGFMRRLTPYFIKEFRERIINIHPALLPSFPGTHSQRDALEYGVKVSGCTVHFVDENVDAGPIILQRCVPVLDNDTEETLAARILKEEHKVLPLVIKLYAGGRLRIEGGKVRVSER